MIKAIKWIIQDSVDDVKWIIKVLKGEEKPHLNKGEWKKFSLVNTLKACWTWYLLIFAAFFSGMFFGQQNAAQMCNEYVSETLLPEIYEHYAIVPAQYKEISPILNFTFEINKS